MTNALTSGRTQSFTFDNLNRLITAQSTATSGTYCWGQAVPPYGSDNANGYDRYGNLVKIDSIQCSSPALNLSVNGYNQFTAYTYDATGDMLTDGTNTYTWNGEGQLKSAASVNYTYDGDTKRVEKSSGTYYWFSPGGMPLAETDSSGNTQNEYIYFSAGRTARRDSAGNVCRVGGGALARWPPSAAQTARTVFPYAAFTKTACERVQSKELVRLG